LVLLRHGRTAWNLEGRGQGHTDVPLDDVGHAEAAAAAPVLARLGPTRLWSSDLGRALQTAGYVAEATGLPVVPDPRLREYDLGARSGLTPAEFAEKFPAEHAAWVNGDESLFVDGQETGAQVRERLEPVLREYLAALQPGETGVAVLHGGCLKDGLFALLGWPAELSRTVRGMDNCGWAIVAEGARGAALRLESYNETAAPGPHLADFASDGPVG
jgi:broad specificity phosphatase PhoE